jgi:hypothetical protein
VGVLRGVSSGVDTGAVDVGFGTAEGELVRFGAAPGWRTCGEAPPVETRRPRATPGAPRSRARSLPSGVAAAFALPARDAGTVACELVLVARAAGAADVSCAT